MRSPSPSSSPLLQIILMHTCILSNIKKRFGLFPKKPVDSSGCASEVGSSNQMNEEMAKDRLKDLFEPLISLPCQ